jgi:hypothetical protein
VGLARDSANDAIHKATPWAAREGSHIAPDRRLSQEDMVAGKDNDIAPEAAA